MSATAVLFALALTLMPGALRVVGRRLSRLVEAPSGATEGGADE